MFLSKTENDESKPAFITVQKEGKWGVLNLKWSEVLPCEYDSFTYSVGYIDITNVFIAENDGKVCLIDEDNQIQKEFFSENGSMYSTCGLYDYIFYVIAGLETSILIRNFEELAHINGMSGQYAYKEDMFIVNNNVRLSPDGMGVSYSEIVSSLKSEKFFLLPIIIMEM